MADGAVLRKLQIGVLAAGCAAFVGAEVFRVTRLSLATHLSAAAWAAFATALLIGVARARGVAGMVRVLATGVVLTLASTAVLLAYYLRSGVLASGVHVDAAYTYLGVTWFLEGRNP